MPGLLLRYFIFALSAVAALVAFALLTSGPSQPTTAATASPAAVPQGPTLSPIYVYQKPNAYDWNKDSCADLITRQPDGELALFNGTCVQGAPTTFTSDFYSMGYGWSMFSALILPGDFDHDGCADLIGRRSASLMVFFPGDCEHGFKQGAHDLFFDWTPIDWIVAVGSWDGDGCMDLMGRNPSSHKMILFPGNCAGNFTLAEFELQVDFSDFDWFNGPTHWDFEKGTQGDKDFCGDLLARKASDQSLWFFDGDCANGFGFPAEQIGTGWGGFDFIESGGDWDTSYPNYCPDIMARRIDSGELRFYTSDCVGGFSAGDLPEGGTQRGPLFNEYIVGDAGVTFPFVTPTPSPTPFVLKGDLDCDIDVDLNDLTIELRFIAALDPKQPATCQAVADMNCDLTLTAFDPFTLLRALVNLPVTLPQNCPPILPN